MGVPGMEERRPPDEGSLFEKSLGGAKKSPLSLPLSSALRSARPLTPTLSPAGRGGR